MATCSVDANGRVRRPTVRALDAEVLKHYRAMLYGLPGWVGGGHELLRTLGITSCRRYEGVSTVAWHVAATAAAVGRGRVLLVDANVAAPSLHRVFHLQRAPGLAEALAQPGKVAQCIQPSRIANLSLLPAGKVDGGTALCLAPETLSCLLEAFRTDFDFVVFDLPAGIMENSVLCLAGLLDGVLLVVEAERTRWETARQMKDFMARASINLLGAVLNRYDHQPSRG